MECSLRNLHLSLLNELTKAQHGIRLSGLSSFSNSATALWMKNDEILFRCVLSLLRKDKPKVCNGHLFNPQLQYQENGFVHLLFLRLVLAMKSGEGRDPSSFVIQL